MHLQEQNYGADVDGVNQKLAKEIGILCCTDPDEDTLSHMSNLYAVSPVVVWVDTPLELANKRLLASGNERRMGRVHHKLQSGTNAAKIKQLASIVFEPVHDVRVDEANFVGTLQQIMQRGSDAGVL